MGISIVIVTEACTVVGRVPGVSEGWVASRVCIESTAVVMDVVSGAAGSGVTSVLLIVVVEFIHVLEVVPTPNNVLSL